MNHRAVFLAAAVLAIIFAGKNLQNSEQDFLTADQQIKASSVSLQEPVPEPQPFISNIPEPPPEINLQSGLVKNLNSNFYFLEIKPRQRWPLASLTKLLTAVVALEEMPESEEVSQLVRLMMIISSNDAAQKIADLYGKEKFVEAMREKAAELRMNQTSVFDSAGLSFLNQSTVEDLEKLVIFIVKNHPKIFQFSRETEVVVNSQKLPNINRFAGQPNFMGGKTGYTDEASGNLVSIFQYKNQPVLIIVLGAADQTARFQQTELIFQWISKFYN